MPMSVDIQPLTSAGTAAADAGSEHSENTMTRPTLESDLAKLLEEAYSAGQKGAALAPTKASLKAALAKHALRMVPDGLACLPVDFVTHAHDFQKALVHQRDAGDAVERARWQKTIDLLEESVRAASAIEVAVLPIGLASLVEDLGAACVAMRNAADVEDVGYWDHQIRTVAFLRRMLGAQKDRSMNDWSDDLACR